jgi:hypothetical protein
MASALCINDGPKVKTTVTAGMLSQSGLISFSAAQSVDNNTATQGWHTDTSVAGSWLQIDLGAANARRIRACRIFVSTAYGGLYDIEFSDNAIDWINAVIGFAPAVAGSWNNIEWTDVGSHRYWRLFLTNTPGSGGSVREVELYESPQIDVATYGFTLSEAPGWLDLPPRQIPSAPIIGRPGAKELATAQENPRRLTLRGTVRGATAAIARANVDALKLAFMAKPLSLSFADFPDRHVFVSLEGFVPQPLANARGPFVQEALQVEATFTAYDPLSYDNTLTIATMPAGSSTPLLVPGTGPIRPVVRLNTGAGAVNPVLSLFGTAYGLGVVVGSLSLTITTGSTDVLEIDMDAKTVKKNGVSVLSAISAGDFFAVEPSDPLMRPLGWFIIPSSGGGTVRYRRSWR